MNIKDKISIVLVILSVVLCALIINNVYALGIENYTLWDLAGKSADEFMSINMSDWKDKSISSGENSDIGRVLLEKKTVMCMYHTQSTKENYAYKISNVIDFVYEDGSFKLIVDGNEKTGNEYTWRLAKALWHVYSTGVDGKNNYELKDIALAAFIQAGDKGGLPNVNSNFWTDGTDKDMVSNESYKNSYISKANKLCSDYGKKVKDYRAISTTTNANDISITQSGNYNIIGPLKVSFGGVGVSKIKINNTDYSTSIKWKSTTDYTGNTGEWKDVGDIPSGTSIYLRIPSSITLSNNEGKVKITICQGKMEYYKVRLMLAYNPNGGGQNLGFFVGKEDKTAENSVEWEIDNGLDLTIKKTNEDGNASGAKFKIKATKNGTSYWLTYSNSKPSYSTNTTFSNATSFTTDENGQVSITGLDNSYTYTVYETAVPNGSLGLEYQVAAGMTVKRGNTSVTPKYDSSLPAIDCGSFTANDGSNITINATNIKYQKLTITKVDETGANVTGAGFKIKATKGSNTYWLTYSNGTIGYSNQTFSNGYEWKTDNGKIEITKLDATYTYTLYETSVPSGSLGLEYQVEAGMTVKKGNTTVTPVYDSTLPAINCGSFTAADGSTITINATNIKYQKLKITKVDETGANVTGAGFKIKATKGSNTYWLTYSNGTPGYSNKTFNNGYEWKTNSSGEIEVTKLDATYTYTIYETSVPDGSLGLEYQVEAGMEVKKGDTKVTPVYDSTLPAINCGSFTAADGSTITINATNIKYKKLTITKVNELGENVSGAGFKIKATKNGTDYWLTDSNGTPGYSNQTFSNGSEWKTNSSGGIEITNLDATYTYTLYETSMPSGYLGLEYQVASGMEVSGTTRNNNEPYYDSNLGAINCGTITESSGGIITINVTNIKYQKLKITKVNELGENVSGAGFKIKATKDGKDYWLTYSNDTPGYSNNEFSKGYEWKTDNNGQIEVNQLDVTYTYTIYETSVPNDYLGLKYQVGEGMTVTKNGTKVTPTYDDTLPGINCGTVSGSDGGIVTVSINNTKLYTNITIVKEDEIDKTDYIKNAEFKIYADGKGWVSYNSSTYTYTYTNSSINNATIWSTGNGNTVTIEGLSAKNTYIVYETKAPDNFLSLEEQIKAGMTITKDGNKVTPKYEEGKGINCGTVSSSSTTSQNITFNVNNMEDYLDISGIIWEDHVGTKSDDYDSLYTNSDSLYTGTVKVSLIDSSGKTVKTVTTTTGEYKIETEITVASSMTNEQVAGKLKGYYIKFEYTSGYKEENSTISYKGTVAPSSATTANGSKALPNENEETKGIAYIYDLSNYVNSTNYESDYNSSKHILKNMNMGLVNISDSYDYNIEETIAYVKVAINGYTYTYEYGGTGKTAATAAPKVQWDNGWAYSRPIYPSDIAYSIAEGWDKDSSLKVYVVYRIDIKDIDPNGNSTMTKEGTTKQVSYVEKNLKVESLKNSYDKDRYELETNYDKSTNGDFASWKKDSDGVAQYTGNKLNNTIAPDETRTVYIQFKVKDKELENLLSLGVTYENKPTVATAKAYHNFWKSYYGWNSSKSIELFKPDEKTAEVEKSAESIYLKLELGTERTATGKVFEDQKVSTNGEALGNGKYDDNENTISDVKIDLILEDGTLASLYGKDNSYIATDATVKSSKNGTYSFVGVTPGKYYIRFTYGDGTQKIVDTSGNEVGTVTIKDYKSTIITEDNIKNALINGDEDWYKKVSDTIHSTAVDNLEQRGEYNKDTTSRNTIQASTALTSISIENTTDNSVEIIDDSYGVKETITGMNFGIIKNPIVEIITEKVVSYIKITNTQGNIIAEGNPATQNIPYVSDLDGNKHLVDGSTYVKVEISEQELYGSKLEIQYSITAQNKSELNYYEDEGSYYGYYYKFGDKSHAKEVTYKVGTVYDYIDSSVKSENISAESPYAIEISSTLPKEEISKNVDNISDCEYLIKITGWQYDLYSNIVNRTDGKKTFETANMKATRILSSDSDDLEVSNVAQVIDVGVPDTPLIPPVDPQEPTEEVITTVIPPTGSDTLTRNIYIAVIAIAGVIIVAGIVIIKKKVIDK